MKKVGNSQGARLDCESSNLTIKLGDCQTLSSIEARTMSHCLNLAKESEFSYVYRAK